jgi:hypothetical protein
MIEITGTDMRAFVKAVYALSVPVGLGILHFIDGELDGDSVDDVLACSGRNPAIMDYVRGRACKMTVHEFDGRWFINDRWFDHSEHQLEQLLKMPGVTVAARDVNPYTEGDAA